MRENLSGAKNGKDIDKILALLKKCHRNRYEPDLHSFFIRTNVGEVYVDCANEDVFILTPDRNKWHEGPVAAAERLSAMGADLSTVEM